MSNQYLNKSKIGEFSPLSDIAENLFNEAVSNPSLNVREYLARVATNSLVSKVIIETKKPEEKGLADDIDELFIKELNKNSELPKLIKGNENILSQNGVSYPFWDIIKENIFIGVGEPNVSNQVIRVNNQKIIAGIVNRTIASSHQMKYLITKELRTPNYTQKIIMKSQGYKYLNLDAFVLPATEYLKLEGLASTTHDLKEMSATTPGNDITHTYFPTHNTYYGRVPMTEMLNTDKIYMGQALETYADCYPALYIENLINDFLKFMRDEPNLNYTTRIGRFSFQDVMGSNNQEQFINGFTSLPDYFERRKILNSPIDKKKFTITPSSDSSVQIQQSTFNGKTYSDYLEHLITIYFKLSGYSYSGEDSANYKSKDEVQSISKNVYETTKMKKRLREESWGNLFKDIYFVWLKQVQFMSEEEATKREEEFDKRIRFEIISNLLNDYLNGTERLKTMKEIGAIDQETLVRKANQDETEETLESILENTKNEQEMINTFFQDGKSQGIDKPTQEVKEEQIDTKEEVKE